MKKRIRIAKQLLAKAQLKTGINTPRDLVHAALKAFVEKEAADELANWIATRPTIESVLGDRMETEPIEVAQALKAAYEAAIEGDRSKAAGMEELRQFDAGSHPAQHSGAAYDVWAHCKTLAALNDTRPPIDGEVVMKTLLARMERHFPPAGSLDTSEGEDDFSSTVIEVDGDLFNAADEYMSVETDSEVVEAALRVLIDAHSALPGQLHE